MRVATGIDDLNKLLLGGFSPGSMVAVMYEELPLARALIPYFYGGKKRLICITTEAQPIDIGGNYLFIDAYSVEKGLSTRAEDKVVQSSASINDISLDLSEALKEEESEGILVFSVSTLLNKNPKDAVYNFIDVFSGRVKEKGGVVILFIDKNSTQEQDIAKLRAMSNVEFTVSRGDGHVELLSNAYPLPLKFSMFANKVVVR